VRLKVECFNRLHIFGILSSTAAARGGPSHAMLFPVFCISGDLVLTFCLIEVALGIYQVHVINRPSPSVPLCATATTTFSPHIHRVCL